MSACAEAYTSADSSKMSFMVELLTRHALKCVCGFFNLLLLLLFFISFFLCGKGTLGEIMQTHALLV